MVNSPRTEHGSKKRIRTGVAISTTEICAADIRLRGAANRSWRMDLEAPPADATSWPSLTSALADLARTLGVTEGTLAISLMPPLTEVRRLDLPPLTDDDLQRLLSRNASRYFVNARGQQIVGASPAARRVRGRPAPVVAAAASARLIASIRAAAEQAGWMVESISPAESAWAGAALALWPAFARQNSYALIAHDDRTDLLQLEDGRLAGVRRFRAGAADAAMIADTVGPTARIGIAGPSSARRELGVALSGVGVTVTSPSGEWSAAAEDPDVLAAQFSGGDVGPTLRTEGAIALEQASARKMTWTIAGAAAALFVVAALIQLWGVHHQLNLVRAERAKIRPQLSSTLVGRTTVDATYRHLAALTEAERGAPQWSAVIANLSESVPEDAHFTAIRARGDSLLVDGLAEHAARVFDALEKTHGLIEVRAASPVRRELQDGGGTLDHFTIAARVTRSVPVELTAPARVSAGPRRTP
jgi:Fimbrial assembly protein (PilN)